MKGAAFKKQKRRKRAYSGWLLLPQGAANIFHVNGGKKPAHWFACGVVSVTTDSPKEVPEKIF